MICSKITNEGTWRLKILEAVGGGVDGLIEYRRLESERLQKLENDEITGNQDQLRQLVGPAREKNKWAWLASVMGMEDSLLELTQTDAELLYAAVTQALGGNPIENPTSLDVADAYSKLAGTVDNKLIAQMEKALSMYPQLQAVVVKAAAERAVLVERFEALLGNLFDDGFL